MLVGYMRVSTDGDRQVLDLQQAGALPIAVEHDFEQFIASRHALLNCDTNDTDLRDARASRS